MPRIVARSELLLAALAAAVLSLGYQLAHGRIDFPLPSEVPTVLASAVVAAAGLAAALAWWSRRGWAVTVAGWLLPALVSTAVQTWLLVGTKFYINGVSGDQLFRTSFLTRFTDSPALADAVYADLPPYYSPAWFWTGGRLADVFGVPGWEWYKTWSILTLAVAASLSYVLWARALRPRTALLLAMLTAVGGVHFGSYEPYSWLLVAVAPPLAILAVRVIARALRGSRVDVPGAVGIGVYLGAASITHALYAGIAALFLVLAVLAIGIPALGRSRGPARLSVGALLKVAAVAAVPLLVIASVVWLPYFLAHSPLTPDSTAADFLPEIGARLPIEVFDPGPVGLLSAIGLVWLVLRYGRSAAATALALVAATCMAWYGLSFAATLFGSTLLAFRVEPVLAITLMSAGVLGVRDGVAAWAIRGGRGIPDALNEPSNGSRRRAEGRLRAAALVTTFALAALVSMAYSARGVEPGWNQTAAITQDPDGVIAGGTELARDSDAPVTVNQLRDVIEELADGRNPRDLVVLSESQNLLAFHPYFGFQAPRAPYANPKAGYSDRNQLIRDWATASDGAALAGALDAAPVRPPDVFVLGTAPDGWAYTLSVPTFPRLGDSAAERVVFDPEVFDSEQFRVQVVGDRAVVVRVG